MTTSGEDVVGRIGGEIDRQGLKRTELYKIVPSGTLSNWKTKGQEPSAYTLLKVADFLDVSVDFILTGKNPSGLPQDEQDLLDVYRLLDQRDRDELRAIAGLKLDSAKRGDTLSNMANA